MHQKHTETKKRFSALLNISAHTYLWLQPVSDHHLSDQQSHFNSNQHWKNAAAVLDSSFLGTPRTHVTSTVTDERSFGAACLSGSLNI